MVKAFNAIGAQHMANPWFGGQSASMFLCGDDSAAKRTVAGLADALGFEPVDVGPLVQARLLEPLAMLWTSMAYAYVQESVDHGVPEGRCAGDAPPRHAAERGPQHGQRRRAGAGRHDRNRSQNAQRVRPLPHREPR